MLTPLCGPLQFLAYLGALAAFVYGLIALFSKRTVWRMQIWIGERRGKVPERSDFWELLVTASGLAALGLAILLALTGAFIGRLMTGPPL